MQPLLSKAILRVVPDPFASPLDASGNPHAFVQFDPEHVPGGGVRYIGAKLDRKVLKPKNITALRQSGLQRQYPRIATTVTYDLTPTGVVDSAYHRQMIRDGALLPADEATAKLLGLKFTPPAAQIELSISARIQEWCGEHPGETIDPAAWKDRIKGPITLAPRAAVTASTVEDRIAVQAAQQKLCEGDGLAKTAVAGDTLVVTGGIPAPTFALEAPKGAGGES